jgi:hypothetical protein
VFRAVSVFPAGFTLDGAEAVAGEAAGSAVLRLADALGWWWFLRGRLPGQCPLLAELTGYAAVGSDR